MMDPILIRTLAADPFKTLVPRRVVRRLAMHMFAIAGRISALR